MLIYLIINISLCASEFTDLSLTVQKMDCFLDFIILYADYMHVDTVSILFFCKIFFFLLSWPLTLSKESSGSKCPSERSGKSGFSQLAFWLRQDWYSGISGYVPEFWSVAQCLLVFIFCPEI